MDKILSQLADKIVPILLVVFMIGLLASQQFLRYRRRVLVHKERLLAMEKGLEVFADPVQSPLPPRVCIFRGLLWLFIGVSATICLLAIAALLEGNSRTVALAWAMTGIVPAGVGCAYLLYYHLQQKK
jgi:hypothetical protein